MQSLTILGSTGSVGQSTLDVVSRHPDRFQVFALTGNTSASRLAEQCEVFRPRYAVLKDKDAAGELKNKLGDSPTTVLAGAEGMIQVVSDPDVDAVMAAIVGGAGLEATLAAVAAGKRLLLANKESLVMSGRIFMEAIKNSGADLLPIDSEHNAIYQCLANGSGAHAGGVKRLLLTGSGGPLLRASVDSLAGVTPDEACAHPNWDMGRKISVDSATMMNKGLELIEASLLFDLPASQIDVVIHPESVVHSMVEYADGSIVAQMGNPDMRTPIAHGLAWPDRIESGVEPLSLEAMTGLNFEAVDYQRFPCLSLCQKVAERSQAYAIALNAANEVAVDRFLSELIRFTDIPVIIEKVLEQTSEAEVNTIETVLALDDLARGQAIRIVEQLT